MGSYIVTEGAEQDLNEISRYIATDNPDAAIRLTYRFFDLFELLAEDPKLGRERPELSPGLRSIPEGNYILFYRIWAREVGIVRVVHAARDLHEIFS